MDLAVIVVGSGKGGVGKSVVSVLLASVLAAAARRPLLCAAADNLATPPGLLGVRPAARLEALLAGELGAEGLLRPVADRLWLLPGDSGSEALHHFSAIERARLNHRLSRVFDDFDVVIVDAAAGIRGVVRTAAIRASRLTVVTVPEPTALTDAYALMKLMHLQVPNLPLDVLVNRCHSEEEGRVSYERLATACERFLRRRIRYLGALPEDPAVRAAVRDPARCLARLAESEAAQSLRIWALDRMELPDPTRSIR
jgi:flagellar biosynthesis protein FlhG